MNTKEILQAVRDKIADPAHHTIGAYARDANGREVDKCGPDACQWCVAGAIYSVTTDADASTSVDDVWRALRTTSYEMFGIPPIDLNDQGDHAAIIAALDAAIEAEK